MRLSTSRLRFAIAAPLLGVLFAPGCSSDPEPVIDAGPPVLASCNYVSPFTDGNECREYVGEGWDGFYEAACTQLNGDLETGGRCSPTYTLGRCLIDGDSDSAIDVFIYGDDAGSCDSQKMGCELFGGGVWTPDPICDGAGPTTTPGGTVFIPPTLECRDPIEGEPVGASEDGKVCTWQLISGATEEGRRFSDYASCDVVRTQRPYYPAGARDGATAPDPRLQDPAYKAELDWVTNQIASTACICCHSDEAPDGASNWSIDAEGNWMNGFYDSGLAFGANYIPTFALGAFPAEENNGFERETSGFPSTDPERMRAFFIAELEHRGLSQGDVSSATPFGGPLYDQVVYEPSACDDSLGITRDGMIQWTGGGARYVYVLEAGSDNPTVPPNLDRPTGTIWRIDVSPDSDPLEAGSVRFGDVPAGASQTIPANGAPPALEEGKTYYLNVQRDVGFPITRCLFEY